ncbi:heat repeat protein [Phlyctema vagabunda]|uniref:Heat repeat protein n=1 Tax=Phlyctema vagabunda TaxID=108571 RepID=A0ABR4P204_9HELO
METGARSARNELFQELRPRCIELSELARRDDGTSETAKAVIASIRRLLSVLQVKCQREDGGFDEKLADYVFFPLSLILRRKQSASNQLTELTLKCLHILLCYGWKTNISLELAKQLLLLLTFIAGGVPGQDAEPAPEELVIEAYAALDALFQALGNTPKGSASLAETSSMPALGHCVTVILEGITDGPSTEAQLAAVRSLGSVWKCIRDQQALSTFLPGTISALTKSLIPTTGSRRSRKTLVTAIEVLQQVLTSILSDVRTRSYKDKDPAPGSEQQTLTKPWLKATTGQIKLALANVIKLRNHDAIQVREALHRLCLTLLDECHETLTESASMLVETAMILKEGETDKFLNRETTLVDLATIHTDIGELIKNTTYNWTTSLSRSMQASDETAKIQALSRLSKAQGLLSDLNLDSPILEDTLAASLRDSITVLMDPGKPSKKALQEASFDLNSQALTTLATENAQVKEFKPILMAEESQKQTRSQLTSLLSDLGPRQSQIKMASGMLDYMRGSQGPSLLSAYWLAFHLLRAASSANADLDEFFESSLTLSDDQELVDQELFSYSVSYLSETNDSQSEPQDWRMKAIALEVVASTALRMKESFRTELIDTLYPITSLLGSTSPNLRSHAITTLNILASSCNYLNTSAMIVDNVDYMVNAISLRLNTFDISPQAPQVLIMMIRLTGPTLLLYLDDVVASIFAALDNFHGYQRLVELLFSVLSEIVDVGSKSEQLQLPSASTPASTSIGTESKVGAKEQVPSISSIVSIIKKRRNANEPTAGSPRKGDFPREPWKSAATLLSEREAALLSTSPPGDGEGGEEGSETAQQQAVTPPPEPTKASPTKTYTMLRSITSLSQHYLTTSSAHLRVRLLTLITRASVTLAADPDLYLPLINDFWPVVVARLQDPEAFVRIAACAALATVCETAGSFLAGRIADAWPAVVRVARTARVDMERSARERGRYAQSMQLWDALVALLRDVVRFVGVDEDMFAEVLDLFGADLIVRRQDVREALQVVNQDAVWLFLFLADREKVVREAPAVFEGRTFVELSSSSTLIA